MADYEVKIRVKENLQPKDEIFIKEFIEKLCLELDMEVQDDHITYSKRPPYKKLEDIPPGFIFYNKLRKYRELLSICEYNSYLEKDYNGEIKRRR